MSIFALPLASAWPLGIWAQTPSDAPDAADDPLKPKFLWGVVIHFAIRLAMNTFQDWLLTQLSSNLREPATLQRLLRNTLLGSLVPVSQFKSLVSRGVGVAPNVVAGSPSETLQFKNDQESHQGVHIALVLFDRDGNLLGARSLNKGFRTGERFKIKLLSTFDGVLTIDNINPAGQRRQIYPPDSNMAVSIRARNEMFVPLDEGFFFEFTRSTGQEQLVITLRDPRSAGSAQSLHPAYRLDDETGSSLLQQVSQDTYPIISQAIALNHTGQ